MDMSLSELQELVMDREALRRKESDTTERLNWTELKCYNNIFEHFLYTRHFKYISFTWSSQPPYEVDIIIIIPFYRLGKNKTQSNWVILPNPCS